MQRLDEGLIHNALSRQITTTTSGPCKFLPGRYFLRGVLFVATMITFAEK